VRTIYKYPIEIADEQQLKAIPLHRIRHVGLDPRGVPCCWCEVDTEAPALDVTIYVVGTGNLIPSAATTYISSFNQGPFVRHVYF